MRLSPLSVLDVQIVNLTSPDLNEPGYTTGMLDTATRRTPSRNDPSKVYSYNNEAVRDDDINKTEYYISEKYSYDYERRTPIKSEDSDRLIRLNENRRPFSDFTRENDFYRLPPSPNNYRIHHIMPYENRGIYTYPPPRRESYPYRRPPSPPPQYRHPPPQYQEISFYDDRQTSVLPSYDRFQHRMPHPPAYRRPPPSYQRRWPPPRSDRGGPLIYDGSPPLSPLWDKGPLSPLSGKQSLRKDYADRLFDFERRTSNSSSQGRDTQSQQYTKSNKDLPKTQLPLKDNSENKLRPAIDLNSTRSMEQSSELIAKKYENKENFNKFASNTKSNHSIEDAVESIIDVRFNDDLSDKGLNHITNVKSKEVSQQPLVYPLLPNFFQVVPVTPKS